MCLGDFNEKSKPNSDMAVYKFDWTDFMTPEEVKEQTEEVLTPLIKPKHFDLKKAKRVIVTREEIKMRELAEEAERSVAI